MDYSKYFRILDKNSVLEEKHPKGKIFKIVRDYCEKYNINTIVVSLSGGVDSMVIAHCASFLGKKVIGGHMNYGNREETALEEEFVRLWCKNRGIEFELLDFGLKRTKESRDEYEKETRKMRYDFYKHLLEKYDANGIFLGHHLNDVAENTFCNVVHGRSLLDLSVIRETSVVLGVNIYRPFRDIPKSMIYEFAHSYGVPYFKDTTPDWSNRGKLRQVIFPQIEDTFEKQFQMKLYQIAKQSDELQSIVRKLVIEPALKRCEVKEDGIVIVMDDNMRNMGDTYWMILMQELMHSNGRSMPKQNVIKEMVVRLAKNVNFRMDFKKGEILVVTGNIMCVKNK